MFTISWSRKEFASVFEPVIASVFKKYKTPTHLIEVLLQEHKFSTLKILHNSKLYIDYILMLMSKKRHLQVPQNLWPVYYIMQRMQNSWQVKNDPFIFIRPCMCLHFIICNIKRMRIYYLECNVSSFTFLARPRTNMLQQEIPCQHLFRTWHFACFYRVFSHS